MNVAAQHIACEFLGQSQSQTPDIGLCKASVWVVTSTGERGDDYLGPAKNKVEILHASPMK
jgi:hypothetical protein